MVRFKYHWDNLNNMNNGFFGLGKSRAKVRFEVGKYDPSTKKFRRLRSTPFVQNEKKNGTYLIPNCLLTLSQICDRKMNQKIRFAVFDTTDLLINQVTLSINELLEETKYEADEKSTITFDNFEIYDRPSFLEYLAANW